MLFRAKLVKALLHLFAWLPLPVSHAIGALIGVGTALLLINRVEEDERLEVSPSQGLKLGLAGLTFLRTVTQLSD